GKLVDKIKLMERERKKITDLVSQVYTELANGQRVDATKSALAKQMDHVKQMMLVGSAPKEPTKAGRDTAVLIAQANKLVQAAEQVGTHLYGLQNYGRGLVKQMHQAAGTMKSTADQEVVHLMRAVYQDQVHLMEQVAAALQRH